ncbi:UrcA family protein [Sphingopyxis terrae]|uniref:UrcA family protein n=1 Tax=Sphingopyxis terrae TaxID=33052 RepID=UPI0013C3E7D5|nr:UrcA family protein [Sphingopyxis terrae]
MSAGAAVPVANAAETGVADSDAAPTVIVPYSDLNLSSVKGRARLEARLRIAIRDMCRANPRPNLFQRAQESDCTANARRSAASQMAVLFGRDDAKLALERPAEVAAR